MRPISGEPEALTNTKGVKHKKKINEVNVINLSVDYTSTPARVSTKSQLFS